VFSRPCGTLDNDVANPALRAGLLSSAPAGLGAGCDASRLQSDKRKILRARKKALRMTNRNGLTLAALPQEDNTAEGPFDFAQGRL
jgi:hypothetical protein